MKLPWKTRSGKPKPETARQPEDQGPRIEVHPSPALKVILTELPRDEKIRILDFGPAVAENVSFLAQYAVRIQVVDALRESLDSDLAVRVLDGLVSDHSGIFDLVLLWDHLDYMPPAQGAEIVEAALPLCRPDARCMVQTRTTATMSARPLTYRVRDEKHLVYEWLSREETGAPQMTPAAVEEVLKGFSIEHAFVLRNGVREYVATRNPLSVAAR